MAIRKIIPRVRVGPRRAFEGMKTTTTVAQHEALIREQIDRIRKEWDHKAKDYDNPRSSRSAILAVRQELKLDGSWERIFDVLVSRVVNK